MKEEYKERVDADFMYLCVSMKKEIKTLIKFLANKDHAIINAEEEEDIMDEASDTLKAQVLLEKILKKDDKAYDNLYEGALHSHLWKAADILMPEKGPHLPKEEDIEEFLPDNWPIESHFEVIKNPQNITVKKVGTQHTRITGLFENSARLSSDVYNMTHKVKGRVLLIVNTQFKKPRVGRPGLEYDKKGLDQLFAQLRFEIDIKLDLTTKEMWDVLEDRAGQDFTNHNCFILVLLTYGIDNKYAYGIDGPGKHLIDIEKVRAMYASQPTLGNKPKIFILMMPPCPKYSADPGMSDEKIGSLPKKEIMKRLLGKAPDIVNTSDPKTTIDSMLSLDGIFPNSAMGATSLDHSGMPIFDEMRAKMQISNSQLSQKMGMLSGTFDGLDTDGGDNAGSNSPPPADFYQAIATSGEMLIHQNKDVGSWFIQAFIYVAATYAHQCDLATLIEKVNSLVKDQNQLSYRYRDVQNQLQQQGVCQTITTLNKKLYFFPGLPIES